MKPMTPAEVAEKANVSLSLVYALLKKGAIKALRIGARGRGKWLVMPDDFDAWLNGCKFSELPPQGEEQLKWV